MNKLSLFLLLAVLFLSGASVPSKADANIQILASFVPAPNGLSPYAPLVEGTDGSLYGTVSDGGAYGVGTIFKVLPTGAVLTLHSLNGTTEGGFPNGLIEGRDGNFYSTAAGDFGNNPSTIFKITPKGVFTVLASLDIQTPTQLIAGLVQGTDGNFYGLNGNAVFRMTPAGVVTTLGSLTAPEDGSEPTTPLIVGADHNIYGTYFGTIFKVTLDGTVTPLVQSGTTTSYTNLIQGADGNFYGLVFDSSDNDEMFQMTSGGVVTVLPDTQTTLGQILQFFQGTDGNFYGTSNSPSYSIPIVFKMTPAGVTTILATANSDPNAQYGTSTVIQGRNGIFYGTTVLDSVPEGGTLFRMTAAGKVTTLYSFQQTGGSMPVEALVEGAEGNFYGVTSSGGLTNDGTAYEVTSKGVMRPLVSFGGAAGRDPTGLTVGKDGNFYGATYYGGVGNGDWEDGTFYKLTPQGVFTVLNTFGPYLFNVGTLMLGLDGDFYGTTEGTDEVFKITPGGVVSPVFHFPLGTGYAGSYDSSLVQGKNGMIYGTTYGGGQFNVGSFFGITPTGNLPTFVSFDNVTTTSPLGDILMGADGNIYWEDSIQLSTYGTICKVTPQGVETTFATFNSDTMYPENGLIQDKNGIFYGVTPVGGPANAGAVFSVDHAGNVTVLGHFDDYDNGNGSGPNKLVLGKDGNLYGTTNVGGTSNNGYVFRVLLPHPAAAPTPSRPMRL